MCVDGCGRKSEMEECDDHVQNEGEKKFNATEKRNEGMERIMNDGRMVRQEENAY